MTVKDIDRGWAKIMRELSIFQRAHVFVGLQGAAATETIDGATIVEIGAAHEFGTTRVPERSWLRSTMDDQQNAIVKKIADELAAVADGRRTAIAALKRLGLFAVELIRKKIRSRIAPPLSSATIAAKGSTVPLIDTGRMMQSITYVVKLSGQEIAAG
ncbi:MAG: hypothetical protein GY926_19620 [bacterium]|nr:hypothetical protein [bacterium]